MLNLKCVDVNNNNNNNNTGAIGGLLSTSSFSALQLKFLTNSNFASGFISDEEFSRLFCTRMLCLCNIIHFYKYSQLVRGINSFQSFRRVIRILVSKKTDSRQYHTVLRGVKKNLILELFSKNEKCSPFISWMKIHIYFCDTAPVKACANVLRNGF